VAIAFVGTITLLTAFLGRAVLEPIAEVGSLAGALGWLAACMSLACGASGKTKPRTRALGIVGAVVSVMLILVAARVFAWYHWLALASWGALGLALWQAAPGRRQDAKRNLSPSVDGAAGGRTDGPPAGGSLDLP
jgi:hypothetical protein